MAPHLYKPKHILKADAIPSVFAFQHKPATGQIVRGAVQKRQARRRRARRSKPRPSVREEVIVSGTSDSMLVEEEASVPIGSTPLHESFDQKDKIMHDDEDLDTSLTYEDNIAAGTFIGYPTVVS